MTAVRFGLQKTKYKHMKKSKIAWVGLFALAWACSPKPAEETEVVAEEVVIPDNSLSDEEKSEGWMLLFDGSNTDGWRAFNGDSMPPNWIIEEGALKGLGATGGEEDRKSVV